MTTIIRDRAPLCRTCKRTLESWYFGASDESERCDGCQKRAFAVSIRAIGHDLRMAIRLSKKASKP